MRVDDLLPHGGDLSGGLAIAVTVTLDAHEVAVTYGACRFGALAVNATTTRSSSSPRTAILSCVSPACESPMCEAERHVAVEASVNGGAFTTSRRMFLYSDVSRLLVQPERLIPIGGPRRGGTPIQLLDSTRDGAPASRALAALAPFRPQLRLGHNEPVDLDVSAAALQLTSTPIDLTWPPA
jgi:hypothetical protein